MNTFLWIAAGALVGWIAWIKLQANAHRGVVFSIVLGMLGAFLGGYVLAPLFTDAAAGAAGEFSPFALVLACAGASVCLALSDFMYQRFGA